MTHVTASAVPPQDSPDTIEYADVLRKSDELWQPIKEAIAAIMYRLTNDFLENGALHGETLIDIASRSGQCTSDLIRAAFFLERRNVISLTWDAPNIEGCRCDACLCRQAWIKFPYDHAADESAILADREREREAAVRRAQQIAARAPSQLRSGEGVVYLIRSGPRHKIGITTNLNRRIDQLKAQAPYPLEVVHTASGKRYAQMESQLHRAYEDCRVHGEWFELDPDQVAAVIESMNEWAAKGGD
jgi:hypothetical protein